MKEKKRGKCSFCSRRFLKIRASQIWCSDSCRKNGHRSSKKASLLKKPCTECRATCHIYLENEKTPLCESCLLERGAIRRSTRRLMASGPLVQGIVAKNDPAWKELLTNAIDMGQNDRKELCRRLLMGQRASDGMILETLGTAALTHSSWSSRLERPVTALEGFRRSYEPWSDDVEKAAYAAGHWVPSAEDEYFGSLDGASTIAFGRDALSNRDVQSFVKAR
jgi:hypothetical protein